MSDSAALLVSRLVMLYLAAGAVFAVPFALRGAARLEPAARGGTAGFRLLILPGAALLWPLLLTRWIGAARASTREPARRTAR